MSTINDNPNEESCTSQNRSISEYLEKGKTITSLEAVRLFGCMRLASRIHDIKEDPLLCSDVSKVRIQDLSTKKMFDAYYSESAIARRHGYSEGEYSSEDVRKAAYVYAMSDVNGYYR